MTPLCLQASRKRTVRFALLNTNSRGPTTQLAAGTKIVDMRAYQTSVSEGGANVFSGGGHFTWRPAGAVGVPLLPGRRYWVVVSGTQNVLDSIWMGAAALPRSEAGGDPAPQAFYVKESEGPWINLRRSQSVRARGTIAGERCRRVLQAGCVLACLCVRASGVRPAGPRPPGLAPAQRSVRPYL